MPPDQPDILTVTLNPALDLASEVEEVRPGLKLRCAAPQVDPGGGGINVARAISRLGGQARAFVALGGGTGIRLERLIRAEGIIPVEFEAPGETRQSLAVTDLASGEQYRFVLPGPDWSERNVAQILAAIAETAAPGGFVVLSGSQPPGVGPDFPGRLADALTGVPGLRLIVDTSGPALLDLGRRDNGHLAPCVLRMDGEEAEELAGTSLTQRSDSAAFAARLVAQGAAEVVILARGADGSVLADKRGKWHCAGAKVDVKSKIGAGDSFMGAFTWGLATGLDLPHALQWGVAAASAAVTTEATRLFEVELAHALYKDCMVTEV